VERVPSDNFFHLDIAHLSHSNLAARERASQQHHSPKNDIPDRAVPISIGHSVRLTHVLAAILRAVVAVNSAVVRVAFLTRLRFVCNRVVPIVLASSVGIVRIVVIISIVSVRVGVFSILVYSAVKLVHGLESHELVVFPVIVVVRLSILIRILFDAHTEAKVAQVHGLKQRFLVILIPFLCGNLKLLRALIVAIGLSACFYSVQVALLLGQQVLHLCQRLQRSDFARTLVLQILKQRFGASDRGAVV
jgi:hypothetical protein